MRYTNFALAVLTAAVLSACGGSDDNNNFAAPAKPKFASQVTFGDSLSDVGTYQVGAVAQLGGGKYTINGAAGKNWTELLAATLALSAPCPAQQGLNGTLPGFNVPVTNNLNCTNYAQGGARVTNPAGPGNIAYSPLGQLTVPVSLQIANHLSRNGGKFSGTEIVTVMAGGNDVLQLLSNLTAAANAAGATAYGNSLVPKLASGATDPATAAAAIGTAFKTELATSGNLTTATQRAIGTAAVQPGNSAVASPAVHGPYIAAAQAEATAAGNTYAQTNGPGLVTLMSTAGAELGALVRTELVAKGAKYVVLNNLPDVASAPASNTPTTTAAQRTLIAGMVSAFNTALRANIDGLESNVLYVDLYSVSIDQIANPSKYGLTNVTSPACGTNQLGGTSLVCNATNLIAGVNPTSTYLFADGVHPTPYGNTLIAKYVTEQLTARGWL
ncbi:esterase [Massilia sp. PAMC28688]|uniref:SGNH/GDSL hydrolase family protein n=1 Tax=Massilia sp. PAMC28688 TaxID=2861283 RepID=UPI001C634B90|nr:SGNH/GDSL hydrolase family protein [Massilia sp. PAMC28688]QYF95691.1 esterase [Massilia sp. PAMC28688]